MICHMTTSSKGCGPLKLLILSNHFARFGGHRPRCSRNITDLIFHVILQNHVIKELCEVMEQSHPLHIPTLSRLVATGIVVVEIY